MITLGDGKKWPAPLGAAPACAHMLSGGSKEGSRNTHWPPLGALWSQYAVVSAVVSVSAATSRQCTGGTFGRDALSNHRTRGTSIDGATIAAVCRARVSSAGDFCRVCRAGGARTTSTRYHARLSPAECHGRGATARQTRQISAATGNTIAPIPCHHRAMSCTDAELEPAEAAAVLPLLLAELTAGIGLFDSTL